MGPAAEAGHRAAGPDDLARQPDPLPDEESPPTGRIKQLTPFTQVREQITGASSLNVKDEETARGGLAVKSIEC
ncbi:hypothetical protein WJ438_13015 [Streptomyces sp. GD-15H]|uniref:hypothetical protein n=1 Tax=Streptomyces sp. GD-15H TaxID=3129112 RepID=UPI00324BA39E